MNAILFPNDGDDNEGTEIRSWKSAPISWLNMVAAEGDRCDAADAIAEIERRGGAAA